MSLISNNHTAAPASDFLHRVLESLGRIGTGIVSGLMRGTRSMQMARMVSVLNNMSDAQLNEIGVARENINKHAEFLMSVRETTA